MLDYKIKIILDDELKKYCLIDEIHMENLEQVKRFIDLTCYDVEVYKKNNKNEYIKINI